jgi:hypothetical protein
MKATGSDNGELEATGRRSAMATKRFFVDLDHPKNAVVE